MYILIFQHCIKNKINNTNIIKSYSKYDLKKCHIRAKIVLTFEILMLITIVIQFSKKKKKNCGLQSGITVQATPQLPCKFTMWDCWNDWRGRNKDRKRSGLVFFSSVCQRVCVHVDKCMHVSAIVWRCALSLQVWLLNDLRGQRSVAAS